MTLARPPGPPATEPALGRFRTLLGEHLGLDYPSHQDGMLDAALTARAGAHRLDVHRYLATLEARGLSATELQALAPAVTTGETYFFRNIEQFHALREQVLPALLADRRTQGRPLSILSAGCASGEEVYTLAMLLHDLAPHEAHSLLGVDLSAQALRKAQDGLYTAWSLRETPPEARQRWFTAEGPAFRLQRALRDRVRLAPLNLRDEAPQFWQSGRFDVIFVRNVLMYFSRSAMRAALARMARSLADGGYLFLGHSESLRDLDLGLRVCHTHGTFYYRREGACGAADPRNWFTAIGQAAERVRSLTSAQGLAPGAPPRAAPAASAVSAAPAASSASSASAASTVLAASAAQAAPVPTDAGFDTALALFAQERFDEAAHALDLLSEPAAGAAQAQLLRAMLCVHRGALQQAEDIAHAVLTSTPRCAAAHYVIGLCRESAGDLQAATDRHALSARLDPNFALAHLQLGRLARRRGDARQQRQALARAAALLAHESAQRLAMLGGGFDRQALLALCRDPGDAP